MDGSFCVKMLMDGYTLYVDSSKIKFWNQANKMLKRKSSAFLAQLAERLPTIVIPDLVHLPIHCKRSRIGQALITQNRNSQGYSLVTSRTAECHIRKDELERIERLNTAERLANTVQEEQMMNVDTQYDQTDSPDSNAATMADNVSVDNEFSEVNGNNSDIERDMNSDSSSSEEEGVETDVEEFVNEDPFDAPNMPENPVHWFIATFAVLFISRYVVNKDATVLIEFINQLLKIYGKDFQLPTSLIGLQRMTGFSNYTNDIKKSVVCEDCHKVYKQDVPLPTHYNFKKHGS
ncbi:C2H2-type zinc finger transcription factor [Phycomyces blakesleeanus NRRL 1555(-)]|uniref:C2H2-type zinc finger transcription factor n=1 Tax=Phycomyces blakesleeanus (strain ATCC 8743b / DSM 1359 / FGSC 10004 / NBRC 33097 / NRRL 1555) TaxID=763407 RepID=A0A167KP44_PHYB8|nr:C2H2-type zinc finger transcription factor [Phycomyces blakesleeanus NRRL 1555(-)]OAD68549.1 C2H2-type zinc finger transcription factor [Phycomyces blakesleeanus NRRL 1555(-)]|eukprot:XP_018286589.1 C2H2-type zinc finger transcription factor [Phycomyces blakesleeanus NRRL 1555(-)]